LVYIVCIVNIDGLLLTLGYGLTLKGLLFGITDSVKIFLSEMQVLMLNKSEIKIVFVG